MIIKNNQDKKENSLIKMSKKILFIALNVYHEQIIETYKSLGYEVIYENDKPNEGFLCKALTRYQVKLYMPALTDYYKRLFNKYKNEKFDFVLFLRGEFLTDEAMKYYREIFPNTRTVLYCWDSITNYPWIPARWKYFNEVYTFDRQDYLKHSSDLKFLPLFYSNDFKKKTNQDSRKDVLDKKYDYDICFIGTAHADRAKIMRSIQKQCEELGRPYYIYLYMPFEKNYYYNKLKNKDFKGIKKNDIHFKPLPYSEVNHIVDSSKCIVDIESPTQSGLTMRTIEMIGMHKKIITTNPDVINYDFYNENNVLIVDRKDFKVDFSFVDREYDELDDELYEKYSIKHWARVLAGEA